MLLFRLLNAFGLVFNPSEALSLPKQEKKASKSVLPEDVSMTPAGLYKRAINEAGAEWDKVSSKRDATKKNAEVTDIDKDGLIKRGVSFDPIKATEIKKLWASDLSAKDVATLLKDKRGFSLRTIETFYAVFNGANAE